MRRPLLATLLLAAPALAIDKPQTPIALLSGLQELPASTPEDVTQRGQAAGESVAVLAADAALNGWKLCVQDAIARWAELHQGPGTLVDGAYGRCADVERLYRNRLLAITDASGRTLIDQGFARSMIRQLQDLWRPRLTAAALDQDLAAREAEHARAPRDAAVKGR